MIVKTDMPSCTCTAVVRAKEARKGARTPECNIENSRKIIERLTHVRTVRSDKNTQCRPVVARKSKGFPKAVALRHSAKPVGLTVWRINPPTLYPGELNSGTPLHFFPLVPTCSFIILPTTQGDGGVN